VYCVGGGVPTAYNEVYYAQISSTGIGTWVASGNYPVPTENGCSISGNYMYCAGSSQPSYYNNIYYAPVSSTGVGAWTSTTNYPTLFYNAGCTISNGYMYCVGTGNTPFNYVYYAPVLNPGVGTWSSTTPYPVNMFDAWCETPGSTGSFEGGGGPASVSTTSIPPAYVYCIGGWNDIQGYMQGVYYAPISNTGVGTWSSTSSYPLPVSDHSCISFNGYVYCVGGTNGGAQEYNQVYYAPLSSTSIGTWSSTTSYPLVVNYHTCTSLNNYMYCVGGYNYVTGIAFNNVYFAPLSSTGVGTWSSTTSYPTNDFGQACTLYNNYLYCLAGQQNAGGSDVNTAYYAPVSSTGIGTWSSTTNYPIGVQYYSCTSSSNYIYCGPSGNVASFSNSVYYAPISSTGIGTWTSGTNYPLVTGYETCNLYSNTIYCIAGALSPVGGGGTTNSVYYAPVSSTGIGTWSSTTGYPWSMDNTGSACISSNLAVTTTVSYIYCFGSGSSPYNQVYYAPLSSTGMGTWSSGTSTPIPSSDCGSCSLYNGYAYCLGSCSGTDNQVYYAPISSTGVGTWTSSTGYPVALTDAGCSVYNGYLYCIATSATAAENQVYYAPVSSTGVGTWSSSTSYPIQMLRSGCSINNGYVYCVGSNSISPYNQVYYAPVTTTGVGAWTSSTSYPVQTYYTGCSAYNNYLYCVGSITGGQNQVYYAPLSSTGVGAWSAGTNYPISMYYAGCSISNNNLYCIGSGSTNPYNQVYYAPISSTGVGAWSAGTNYPYPLQMWSAYCAVPGSGGGYFSGGGSSTGPWPATSTILAFSDNGVGPWHSGSANYPIGIENSEQVLTYGNNLYCIGGTNSVSGYSVGFVYYAPITSSSVGSWTATANEPIPAGVDEQTCSSSGNYFYCITGSDSGVTSNQAYYAQVLASNGVSWTSTTNYPVNAYGGSSVISGNDIYSVGGIVSGIVGTINVYYAPISSTGVGTWSSTTNYPITVASQSCVTYNNNVYCIGGIQSGGGSINNVYYAPLSSTGVGTWTSGTTYPVITQNPSCMAYVNTIICAGTWTTTWVNTVYYAPILPSNSLGSWTATANYPLPTYGMGCALNGNVIYCVGGVHTPFYVYYAPVLP
jgi:hypothetical protein